MRCGGAGLSMISSDEMTGVEVVLASVTQKRSLDSKWPVKQRDSNQLCGEYVHVRNLESLLHLYIMKLVFLSEVVLMSLLFSRAQNISSILRDLTGKQTYIHSEGKQRHPRLASTKKEHVTRDCLLATAGNKASNFFRFCLTKVCASSLDADNWYRFNGT